MQKGRFHVTRPLQYFVYLFFILMWNISAVVGMSSAELKPLVCFSPSGQGFFVLRCSSRLLPVGCVR